MARRAKPKLRPEDRGTPKDPSYGAHNKRFETAQESDPRGVAAWLAKHVKGRVKNGERFYRR